MKNPPEETISAMVNLYYSGKNIKDIASTYGLSVGKAYYILRDSGCKFRSTGVQKGTKLPKEWVEHSAESRRGGVKPESMKRKLSEARKCHYNGLNGYGHTKPHCNGYELVYAPDHPKAHKDGYVMKHTVIAERAIGRYLHDNEEVHHINHIRNDNRAENLVVMDSREHRSMHMRERKRRNDLSIV